MLDVGRVAAVVQLIVQEGDTIYGEFALTIQVQRPHTEALGHSCERLEETRQGCGLLNFYSHLLVSII